MFSSSGGSLVFGGIFDEFVFPFFVVFDESMSDDEHFVQECQNPVIPAKAESRREILTLFL